MSLFDDEVAYAISLSVLTLLLLLFLPTVFLVPLLLVVADDEADPLFHLQNPIGHSENTDFDAMWDILRSALREIHTKNASKLSFEQLYRASYKIVLKKKGDLLYDRVKEFEEQWFGSEVMPKIRLLITKSLLGVAMGGMSGTSANEKRIGGEKFLKGLKESWEDHNLCMNMTTDVLMYMDRVYSADNRRPSIFTTAMGLFRDHILR